MGISLYQAIIPSYLQITHAALGVLQKAEEHCQQNNLPPEQLINASLIEDMLSLPFQIKSVRHHSIGAIEGVRDGVFRPPQGDIPQDFAGLSQILKDTVADLEAIPPDEIESFIGQPMRFEMGDFKMDFSAEEFLLSFSQPNFYFHASTAYDILRARGVTLRKPDFLGAVRKQD